MKIISWNVNSIRTLSKKINLNKFILKYNPDILCFNEIMGKKYELNFNKKYPYVYWNSSKIKNGGYAGTLILSKIKPLDVEKSPFDDEGRLIKLKFPKFTLINLYSPNSGEKLKRLKYRTEKWDVKLKNYVKKIKGFIIITGDFNVAYNKDIDIWNSTYNDKAGTTLQERKNFKKLLDIGLIDTFREINPKQQKYTYWSYRGNARHTNKGWRIDYFLINKSLMKKVKKSEILDNELGSDHAPIILDIII